MHLSLQHTPTLVHIVDKLERLGWHTNSVMRCAFVVHVLVDTDIMRVVNSHRTFNA